MTVSNVSDEIYIRQFMAGYGHLLFEPELKGKIESFLRSFSQGLDALISGLLTELRTVTESDAATIYVVDKNMLRFAYVQNETIANKSGQGDKKGLDGYVGRTIPIEDGSLCGYVAKTKRPILIGNARDIDPSMPFRYNDAYDREMGYATISVLTAPIVDDAGELAGVLQLLNHKDENGTPEPYKDWML
ncbi:MAG: GAF domain-containing protein, partial [Synergistaceae bacterium]|nr:GAF domain-containing protein [Synergistaceae bacterium]